MPMIWSADANAKLFLGVLEQLKDHKVKLDYKKLAEYMGPDCTSRAVDNQIAKLKKQAENGPHDVDTSAPATPVATPQKRGRGRPPKMATPSKKAKMEDEDSDEVEGEEGDLVEQQIKEELKELEQA